MTKELLPHQQRVVDEQTELEGKLKALREFIRLNRVFDTLPSEERTLLKTQMDLMSAYSNVLGLRIARF
nr:MAG: hypothetical protein [Bacteriophage sp.]